MKIISIIILLLLAVFAFPHQAHAIIFLPALILIPIAKLVAVIIGGFSVPAIGLSTLWSNLFKKSLKRTIGVTVLLLLFFALILILIFKLHDPTRPFF